MIDNQKDNMGNLKDSANNGNLSITDKTSNTLYSKANKLITALFMVTDILDKDEPIRAKLRALGMDIIGDIHNAPVQASAKISQILSFLDIASTIGMVSEMNATILKREFIALNQSINESTLQGNSAWLEKFMLPPTPTRSTSDMQIVKMEHDNLYQGQKTRIGVQKASGLMKALNDVKMSDKTSGHSVSSPTSNGHVLHREARDNFDVLKKQRREEIIKVIKESKEAQAQGGATITDIRTGAKNFATSLGITALLSCSEKTLQRELVSMVKDNVLKKTGEKRWSKYFI